MSLKYMASGSWLRSPRLKAGVGEVGVKNNVDLAKGRDEITQNQAPHFLSTQIIRIIIARTQHIGPQHNPAFDFTAKGLAATLKIHGFNIARLELRWV